MTPRECEEGTDVTALMERILHAVILIHNMVFDFYVAELPQQYYYLWVAVGRSLSCYLTTSCVVQRARSDRRTVSEVIDHKRIRRAPLSRSAQSYRPAVNECYFFWPSLGSFNHVVHCFLYLWNVSCSSLTLPALSISLSCGSYMVNETWRGGRNRWIEWSLFLGSSFTVTTNKTRSK